ncbi:hypothetical protein BJ875DRAFT_66879 [Amylocarpus encephaloides]|uniref:Uncharacterized protein n=1 Tax=Amylocarpus encephaloides TaxID=45428 RepID=A0A9P7YGX6_9HELO|nr:hypothetical protein BJ875DRAFT_66879 [Amylocarpus encephaloides]
MFPEGEYVDILGRVELPVVFEVIGTGGSVVVLDVGLMTVLPGSVLVDDVDVKGGEEEEEEEGGEEDGLITVLPGSVLVDEEGSDVEEDEEDLDVEKITVRPGREVVEEDSDVEEVEEVSEVGKTTVRPGREVVEEDSDVEEVEDVSEVGKTTVRPGREAAEEVPDVDVGEVGRIATREIGGGVVLDVDELAIDRHDDDEKDDEDILPLLSHTADFDSALCVVVEEDELP